MIKEFIRDLNGKNIEGKLIKTLVYSLLTGFVTFGILYFLRLKNISDFIPKYGLYVFLSIVSYSFISVSIMHIRTYKELMCMPGMMIGMTIGMVSGFLPGYFIGGTNGLFYGSIFGIVIGMSFGIWSGKCCGIMGIMEGMMAGFMGGLMGAMTAIMMINDNIKGMAIISVLVLTGILFGLSYMLYKETRQIEIHKKENYLITTLIMVVLTIITIWFMVFGPKSPLFN